MAFVRETNELSMLLSTSYDVSRGELQQGLERMHDIARTVRPFASYDSQAKACCTYLEARMLRMKADISSYLRSQRGTQVRIRDLQFWCVCAENKILTILSDLRNPQPPNAMLIDLRSLKAGDANQVQQYGTLTPFTYIPFGLLHTDVPTAYNLLQNDAQPRARIRARFPITYFVRPLPAEEEDAAWNLTLVQAPQAWSRTRGKGSAIAVIDTGVDYRHTDLQGAFGEEKGADFTGFGDCRDGNGHGTHVAGTIAGTRTGVAPQATLYAVRVLGPDGYGSEDAILQGMEYAISKQVIAMNMSRGSSRPSDAEEAMLQAAHQRGVLSVCAAGNNGDDRYSYPASHEHAISVAAIDQSEQHARFSNHNDRVDLSAPGVAVLSTYLNGGYKSLSGTSMATPHVAGACALLGAIGVKNIEERLKDTAKRLGHVHYFGSGNIQLAEACK